MRHSGLLPVEEALARVLEGVETLPCEEIAVADAHGRILAKPLAAKRDQPPADMSSMDGYAARACDLTGANNSLRVAGESAAGHAFERALKPGEAVRIFTGAVVPEGADTVVAQEDANRDGDSVALPSSQAGKFIRRRGLDFQAGKILLEAGCRLSVRDLALAAAMDHATLPVARRPRVAIIATGDELVEPGAGGDPNRIIASNPIGLSALLKLEGAEIIQAGIIRDRLEDIVHAIRSSATKADLVVTLGGASVGDHDLIAKALEAENIPLHFHRVALRPGRPLLLARKDRLRLIGLPGNPVAVFVCGLLFIAPLLRKMQGRMDFLPAIEPATLGEEMPANDHRQDYVRAKIRRTDDGRLIAAPIGLQDSSMQAFLVSADGLLIRTPNAPAAAKGSLCGVIRFAD